MPPDPLRTPVDSRRSEAQADGRAADLADPGAGGSTSRSLLSSLQRGDDEAWERMVALYAPLVLHWCRRQDLAEQELTDVFQEVFQSVAASIGGFRKRRGGGTFRGWLRTITRSKVCDHFRRLRRQPRASGGTEAQVWLSQVPAEVDHGSESHAPPDAGEVEITNRLLADALQAIRPEFHERTFLAFWGVVVDGRSPKDVGAELSMQPGAVRVAKSRVLHRLRQELGELSE